MSKGRVLAFGCFDLLHPGHVFYLERAKKLGEELVVVVARDSTILEGKYHEPVQDEKTRLEMVKALKPVDKAVLGLKGRDRLRIVGKYEPDIIALGHDQAVTKKEIQQYLKKNSLKAKVVRIPSFKRKRYSSTSSRKKVSLGIEELFD